MKSARRWMSVSAFVACAGAASLAQAHPDPTGDQGAYFCPSATDTYLGKTTPVACNGEQCVGGNSSSLSEPQKQFLESEKGECRYLSEQEKNVLLPEKKPALAAR
jgi:hypothetical protein